MTADDEKHDAKDASAAPIRIAIFDDSKGALERYETHFQAENVSVLTFCGSVLDDQTKGALVAFNPQLIIMDLLIGDDLEDGYKLIYGVGRLEELREARIVVCSKLINLSAPGKKQEAFCLGLPGVVKAFGKIPDIPPPRVFLDILGKPGKTTDRADLS